MIIRGTSLMFSVFRVASSIVRLVLTFYDLHWSIIVHGCGDIAVMSYGEYFMIWYLSVCVCVCAPLTSYETQLIETFVCVCVRERERDGERRVEGGGEKEMKGMLILLIQIHINLVGKFDGRYKRGPFEWLCSNFFQVPAVYKWCECLQQYLLCILAIWF